MDDCLDTISCAAAALVAGGAAVFPTDTVYGLGVAVGYSQTPARLFDIKRRDEGKPVAWLVSGAEDLRTYGDCVPEYAYELAKRYWPGALTLIVAASDRVPLAFQSAQGSIGLRMPDSPVALALIRRVGAPLATTSANISGQPAVSRDADLDDTVCNQADAVVRGVDCPGGCASTVIDCTGAQPVVLRQGDIAL